MNIVHAVCLFIMVTCYEVRSEGGGRGTKLERKHNGLDNAHPNKHSKIVVQLIAVVRQFFCPNPGNIGQVYTTEIIVHTYSTVAMPA